MVTRVGFLENAGLSFSNTMMSYIIQRMPCEMLSYFHLFSVLAWTGESYSGQTKSHLVKQATCGLVFLWKQGEKFSVLKNMGIRVHA